MITLDRATMTLIGHADGGGPFDCGAGGTLTVEPLDFVFQGEYVNGELPGL